jgi:pimeloyl-ACP methyl ester carboxylesterase
MVDAVNSAEMPRHFFALGSSMGAAIALQSAAIELRIAGVGAESSFSDLRDVTFDYTGLHRSPWLGRTLFHPGAWTLISAAQKEGGFSIDEVSPEKSVRVRPFPILLICDGADHVVPCRHRRRILGAATGPKELWQVPGAGHASAIGAEPAEYERRVIAFFDKLRREAVLPYE